MSQSPQQLLTEALKMPLADRGRLAALLIESLEPDSEEDIAASWASEIRRRAAEIDSGEVTLLSWEEVRQSIRGEHGTMAD